MISRERATASPAPPLVFHIAVKMAAAINIPLSFLLKNVPLLCSLQNL